ncbi:MAG: alpha-E domain-containing protein [Burkholderiaceae bacterium]
MLSRVASHLYWLSRYLERAENMARILDVGQSLALLSGRPGDERSVMEPLIITDTLEAFRATGQPATPDHVARFLAWDRALPSSIANCLEASRENARAVRGSITSEMWENINDTWLQLQAKRRAGSQYVDAQLFDWVKERSHLFRGITFATIRRDQPYHFIRLGTYIERADNTARILSVKQATEADVSQPRDDISEYYSLAAVLRSVSAFEAYRDTYRDAVDARRVAELLIFSPQLPRSLRFCLDEIEGLLRQLPPESGRPPLRLAATLRARLAYGDLAEVHAYGLYNFLERFLRDNVRLGEAVRAAYLELK